MTKTQLIQLLEGFDDDIPIYVIDNNTRWPAKLQYRNIGGDGQIFITRDKVAE